MHLHANTVFKLLCRWGIILYLKQAMVDVKMQPEVCTLISGGTFPFTGRLPLLIP